MNNNYLVSANAPTGGVYVNHSGQPKFLEVYDECSAFCEGLAAVKKDGKCGYIDVHGKAVVPLIYCECADFHEGVARVKYDDGRYGFINNTGNKIFDTMFGDCAKQYESGVLQVYGDNCQLFNIRGVRINQEEYDSCNDIAYGLVSVSKDNMAGVIDISGKEIVPCIYKGECELYDDCIVVESDEGLRILDHFGVALTNEAYDECTPLDNGLFLVLKKGRYNILDRSGAIMVSLAYNAVINACCGRLIVQSHTGMFGVCDVYGNIIAPCQYDSISNYSEGLAAVKRCGKYGYIDLNGKEVITPYLEHAGYFSEGLAPGSLADKWGYIDVFGRPMIQFVYDACTGFHNGLAKVKVGQYYGLINAYGEVVIPPYCNYYDSILLPQE